MEQQINLLPEWKVLLDKMAPLIKSGKTLFLYEELAGICGVSIKSQKGRQQFLRFREEALKAWGIWFENVQKVGYRVVPAAEHVGCARKRSKSAQRMTAKGLAIVTHANLDAATEEVKKSTIAAQSVLGAILNTLVDNNKQLRKIAATIQRPELAPSKEEVAAVIENVKAVN